MTNQFKRDFQSGSEPTAIQFENVSFGYGKINTIRNISYHIEKGDFAAVIGTNGAGKSTLCRLSNGLLKPTGGRVLVNGQDTKAVKSSRLAKSIGFLFQNPDRQICQNTIRGEIRFGLECNLNDPAEIDQRCEETLQLFGLNGDHDPFSMSRGERQRIAFASLIACKPEILIVDEPTTGLDYRECIQLMDKLKELNENGTTIIMVSHDMELVLDYAKRVLVVHDGELVGDGPTREIMSNESLLRTASVLPPQIPALALRLNFNNVFTVDEMCAAIESRCR